MEVAEGVLQISMTFETLRWTICGSTTVVASLRNVVQEFYLHALNHVALNLVVIVNVKMNASVVKWTVNISDVAILMVVVIVVKAVIVQIVIVTATVVNALL
jgi:hypothetical protein